MIAPLKVLREDRVKVTQRRREAEERREVKPAPLQQRQGCGHRRFRISADSSFSCQCEHASLFGLSLPEQTGDATKKEFASLFASPSSRGAIWTPRRRLCGLRSLGPK